MKRKKVLILFVFLLLNKPFFTEEIKLLKQEKQEKESNNYYFSSFGFFSSTIGTPGIINFNVGLFVYNIGFHVSISGLIPFFSENFDEIGCNLGCHFGTDLKLYQKKEILVSSSLFIGHNFIEGEYWGYGLNLYFHGIVFEIGKKNIYNNERNQNIFDELHIQVGYQINLKNF